MYKRNPYYTDVYGGQKFYQPLLTFLVGLTCVGKSHYISQRRALGGTVTHVLSTDNIIEDIARKEGITYDDFFDTMSSVQPNRFVAQVLPELNRQIDYATSNDMHVIVDMQNIDKRARALTYDNPKFANYKLQAVVFDDAQLSSKNPKYLKAVKEACASRGLEQDKTIPQHVIERSFYGYERPTKAEGFVEVVYVNSTNPIIRKELMRKNPGKDRFLLSRQRYTNPAIDRQMRAYYGIALRDIKKMKRTDYERYHKLKIEMLKETGWVKPRKITHSVVDKTLALSAKQAQLLTDSAYSADLDYFENTLMTVLEQLGADLSNPDGYNRMVGRMVFEFQPRVRNAGGDREQLEAIVMPLVANINRWNQSSPKKNPAMRRNASDQRKALREEYRKAHGDDWWKKDSIKDKFDAELKKTPKGGFTRGGVSLSQEVDEGIEFAKKRAKKGDKDFTYKEIGKKSRGPGKKKSAPKKSSSRKSSSKHIGKEIKVVGFPSKESGGKEMSESMFVEVISGTVNNGTGKLMNDSVSSDLRYGDIVEFGGGNAKLHPKFKKTTAKTKKKSSSRSFSGQSSYMDKVDIAIEKHFSPVVKKGVSEMQMIDSDIYQWSVGDEGMLELVLIKDSIAIVLDLDNNKIVEVAIKKKDMTPTQLAKQIAAYYKELTGKSSSKKSSSRKSSAKSRAKGSKKQKAEFKIRKSGKSFKWELIIDGDIATRSGYKSKATAKKAFLKAVSENADVIEKHGVDSYQLFCNVRDL